MIYGRAWFERDDAKRVEVLRQCCTEDVVFVDHGQPPGRVAGGLRHDRRSR